MDQNVTTLLILGASGDLTKRLLLPGFGSLLAVEPQRQVEVIGAARKTISKRDWDELVTEALRSADAAPEVIQRMVEMTRYLQADPMEREELLALIAEASGSLVIYFALPPQVTLGVCELLAGMDLPPGTRLAIEKPFGHDLATAEELNRVATSVVGEEDIFRIDHFLGVNTVLNLIGLRFANRIFQPLWSREHIEKVEICYDENLALEGRAGYYDKAGALIDMTQSHLLVVLATFAMESPATLAPVEIRPLLGQALRATSLWGNDPVMASRRARYLAGESDGRQVPAYVDEDGVDPQRGTETLSELIVELRNERWAGVPFVLRSGKALAQARKEIAVTFKEPAHIPDGLKPSGAPDQLILELRPGGIELDISVNAEGDPFELEQKKLSAKLGQPRMTPYGEVLAGILDSNPLLSIRGDTAEQMWRIVGPVLAAWKEGTVPMEEYPAGSAGPDGWGKVPQ